MVVRGSSPRIGSEIVLSLIFGGSMTLRELTLKYLRGAIGWDEYRQEERHRIAEHRLAQALSTVSHAISTRTLTQDHLAELGDAYGDHVRAYVRQ